MKNVSIRIKFVIAIIAIIFTSIFVISSFNYLNSRRILLNDSLANAYNTISSEADKIESWFMKKEAIVETTGRILLQSELSDMEDLLEVIALSNSDITTIYTGFSNDDAYFSDRWHPVPADNWYPTQRDWYIAATENKEKLAVISPYIDPPTLKTVITLSKYIGKTEDGVDMICSADITIEELLQIISEIHVSAGGYAFLTDSSGDIISHTVSGFVANGDVFKNINDYDVYKEVQNKYSDGEKHILVNDFDGEERYITPFKVSDTGFYVYIAFPSSDILNQLDSGLKMTVLISVIILIITIIIINYIANIIVIAPISSIANATERLAAGEFDTALGRDSTDEIGKLCNNFALVDSTLSNVIKEIDKMTKSHANGDYEVMIDENKFPGAYGEVAHGVNQMAQLYIDNFFDFINVMKNFGEGNFDINVREYPGKLRIGNEAVTELRNNLKSINAEITYIAECAIKGELDARIEIEKFNGGWLEISKTLNKVMGAISKPIKEVTNALSEIEKGNLNAQVTGDYQGYFFNIKESLNSTSKTLSVYVNDISHTLAKIVENDLSVAITGEYVGEFIEIKNSINMIIYKFNDILKEINIASKQINIGVSQISASSMNLAEGANVQMEAVSKLVDHIDKISKHVDEYNIVAQKANGFSDIALHNTDLCSDKMNNMLNSIRGIEDAVKSIDTIINLITDIAFQTNLLSLNASVEAARAGEQGKGFSVVAEEVGNLAKRSQKAAKNSQQLITDVMQRVHEGSYIATETSDSLKSIVESIGSVSTMVAGISEAANEQHQLVIGISDNIRSISDVVSTNSASSEESAAAAEELSSQADVFNRSLNRFKL